MYGLRVSRNMMRSAVILIDNEEWGHHCTAGYRQLLPRIRWLQNGSRSVRWFWCWLRMDVSMLSGRFARLQQCPSPRAFYEAYLPSRQSNPIRTHFATTRRQHSTRLRKWLHSRNAVGSASTPLIICKRVRTRTHIIIYLVLAALKRIAHASRSRHRLSKYSICPIAYFPHSMRSLFARAQRKKRMQLRPPQDVSFALAYHHKLWCPKPAFNSGAYHRRVRTCSYGREHQKGHNIGRSLCFILGFFEDRS